VAGDAHRLDRRAMRARSREQMAHDFD